MRTVVWPSLSETQQESVLERPAISAGANITATVQDLISQVRREGDKALLALT
ncbi:histidinol dehydrogenase, partial [Vibrio metschnikovii]|nr:histidinol dehydrogenase [Vibrio metschnikovii]